MCLACILEEIDKSIKNNPPMLSGAAGQFDNRVFEERAILQSQHFLSKRKKHVSTGDHTPRISRSDSELPDNARLSLQEMPTTLSDEPVRTVTLRKVTSNVSCDASLLPSHDSTKSLPIFDSQPEEPSMETGPSTPSTPVTPVKKETRKRKKEKEKKIKKKSSRAESLIGPQPIDENEEVPCPCTDHEGELIINRVIPLNIEKVFQSIYTDCSFARGYYDSRKSTNLNQGEWQLNADQSKTRIVSYTAALNNAVGPKSANCTETQNCFQHNNAGKVYVIQIEIKNEGVPYEDDFVVKQTICITKVSADQTRFKVHSHIHWIKPPWAIPKSIIEKNSSKCLKENFAFLINSLSELNANDITDPREPSLAEIVRLQTIEESSKKWFIPKEGLMAKFIILALVLLLLLNGALFVKLWIVDSTPCSVECLEKILDKFETNREIRFQGERKNLEDFKSTLDSFQLELDNLKFQLKSLENKRNS